MGAEKPINQWTPLKCLKNWSYLYIYGRPGCSPAPLVSKIALGLAHRHWDGNPGERGCLKIVRPCNDCIIVFTKSKRAVIKYILLIPNCIDADVPLVESTLD